MNYGKLKPKNYIKRLIDSQVKTCLSQFGAIDIQGPKWCGKSWTAQAFGNSIEFVDTDIQRLADDPSQALVGDEPHIIDEWQDVPIIWNHVRHAIDNNAGRPGQFILTGSSTPVDSAFKLHSGAGRIAQITMNTMTLAERGLSSQKVSLAGLFEQDFTPHKTQASLPAIEQAVCAGGWPQIAQNTDSSGELIARQYLQALFQSHSARGALTQDRLRKTAQALARNDGTPATITTIQKDVFGDDEVGSRVQIERALTYLKSNYFFREIPAWDAPIKSKARLRKTPKRYVIDPSLTVSLLKLTPERLHDNYQLFGTLFESLAVHDLDVYARLLPHCGLRPLHYFATADGLEIDVIIELDDGRWGAIEIKTGPSKVEKAAASLMRLKRKIAENPVARNPQPSFLVILLATSQDAYQRSQDGIYVFPLQSLTA